jgi:Glycine cleavage system T protein (aminomethyltransferase)
VALKSKGDFIGRAALEALRSRPPFVAVGLTLAGNEVARGGQGVYAEGQPWRIGQVTSGTFSPLLNRSIAIAHIVPDYAQLGTVVEVGFLDGIKRRDRATVGPLSPYDPTKSRVKA